ncbi:hypothetical protein CHS0354_010556 [Potamilus streckersoni]|uniref:Uncharacterized protein n=1 Tax=Potamilus streckersoni TaxID=2493646 RepID=A0AAE0S5U0_9BIVA|nr:hypothetical protein CHS0354_010556 [Potamilus streckersoni]
MDTSSPQRIGYGFQQKDENNFKQNKRYRMNITSKENLVLNELSNNQMLSQNATKDPPSVIINPDGYIKEAVSQFNDDINYTKVLTDLMESLDNMWNTPKKIYSDIYGEQ